LAVIDPAKVDDAGRIDLLVAFERQIACCMPLSSGCWLSWMVGVELEREAEDRLHQEQVELRCGSHPPRR